MFIIDGRRLRKRDKDVGTDQKYYLVYLSYSFSSLSFFRLYPYSAFL